jgi:hypothetical protein
MILAEPSKTILFADIIESSVICWMKLMPPANVDGEIFGIQQGYLTMSQNPP